jgi:hypothetical protein
MFHWKVMLTVMINYTNAAADDDKREVTLCDHLSTMP